MQCRKLIQHVAKRRPKFSESEPYQEQSTQSAVSLCQHRQSGGTRGSGRGSRRGAHCLPLSQLPLLLPVLIVELDLDLLSLTASPAEEGGARSAASREKLVAGGLGGSWRWVSGGGRSGQSFLEHHTEGRSGPYLTPTGPLPAHSLPWAFPASASPTWVPLNVNSVLFSLSFYLSVS